MKKSIFAIAALAVLAVGCMKEEKQPAASSDSAGKPAIVVSVVQTKVSISPVEDTGQGQCFWQEGDQLAVYYQSADESAGEIVTFTYSEDYEDGTAKFLADAVPTEGYVPVRVAHPVGSVTESGFSLVKEFTFDAENPDRLPVYLRSEEISLNEEGLLSAQLHHNASVLKFVLHDVPAYAAGLAFESVRYKDESGAYVEKGASVASTTTVKTVTRFPYKTGYTADPASSANDVTLYVAAAHSSYPSRVYLIDGDGDEVEGSAKTFNVADGTKWIGADDYIEFNTAIDFKKSELRKDYVKVCGVKWAKGNLQSKSTFAEDGFQPRWRIAPDQWHNFKYAEAATSTQTEAVRYDYSNNADEFEHFNFGGIARNSRFFSDGNFLKPSAAIDISGKIFSDINAATEVEGDGRFKSIAAGDNAGIYGDVAFWATKGKYRMPSNAEMKKFHNVSDKLLGYYVTSEGIRVWGVLLRTPNPKRATNKAYVEFNDADLESGVFLPNAGRRSNSSSNSVIAVTTQGTYRTSNYIKSVVSTNDKNEEVTLYYSSYYHFANNAPKLYDDTVGTMGTAYDHAAGFLIRPVLVEAAAE